MLSFAQWMSAQPDCCSERAISQNIVYSIQSKTQSVLRNISMALSDRKKCINFAFLQPLDFHFRRHLPRVYHDA